MIIVLIVLPTTESYPYLPIFSQELTLHISSPTPYLGRLLVDKNPVFLNGEPTLSSGCRKDLVHFKLFFRFFLSDRRYEWKGQTSLGFPDSSALRKPKCSSCRRGMRHCL